MKEYGFHPFSEEYPLMPAFELGRMEESMRERGFDPRFPVILYQGKVLDGRNRYLAAKSAELKAIPTETFKGSDDEARRFVITANEERRHLAQEWLQRRRQERISRVATARANGESLRGIAANEGVSESQVRRDLQEPSGAPGGAPETSKTPGNQGVESQKQPKTGDTGSGKITGRDGKTYAATKPKPVCSRCQRVGEMENCEACAALRKKPRTLSDKASAALAREEDEPEEKTIEDEIKAHNSRLECWCRQLMQFAETMPDDPWLQDLNRRDGALRKLRDCCETIRSAKCVCVCPKCEGAGCKACRKTGRLTSYAKGQL